MERKEGKKEEQGRTPFSHQACPLCIFKKRKNEKWGGPSSHQGLTLIFSKNWVGVPKVQYVLLGGCTATSEVQSTFWALGGQWAGSLSLTEVEEGNTTYLASSFCRPICSSRAAQKGFPRMPPLLSRTAKAFLFSFLSFSAIPHNTRCLVLRLRCNQPTFPPFPRSLFKPHISPPRRLQAGMDFTQMCKHLMAVACHTYLQIRDQFSSRLHRRIPYHSLLGYDEASSLTDARSDEDL